MFPSSAVSRVNALELPEARLAALREDLGDRHPFSTRDLQIEVEELAIELRPEQHPHRALSRSGEPDEDDVRTRRISRRGGLRGAKGRH